MAIKKTFILFFSLFAFSSYAFCKDVGSEANQIPDQSLKTDTVKIEPVKVADKVENNSGKETVLVKEKTEAKKETKKAPATKRAKAREEKYQVLIDEYKKIKPEEIKIDNKNMKAGEKFLWGAGTSSYQVEGHDGATEKMYCHWQTYIGKKITIDVDGKKEDKEITDPGVACQHWKRYKEDIKLLKDLGLNTYRFSLSWGKIMPKEGEFNEAALKHYEDVCKELKKNGIKPIITIMHYAYPVWFADKGAFEKEENVKYFVDFGLKVFERLNKYNPIWFTINTFIGSSMHPYYMGTKAPFKKDMGIALKVLKNLLQAHVEFYRKAKEIAKTNKQKSKIGFYHIIFPIEKYSSWQFWDGIGVDFVEKINNKSVYKFFTDGVLDINIGISILGLKHSIKYINKDAIGAFDCVGLNYYTGAYMSNFNVLPRKECIPMQGTLATIYPEGFYRALTEIDREIAKKFGVPIYVTENGIPTNNPDHRDVYYRTHIRELSRAIKDGVDVRGYVIFALLDGFDWMEGYDFNYGLYAVDMVTQKRTLKKGTEFITQVINCNKKDKINIIDSIKIDTVPKIGLSPLLEDTSKISDVLFR